MTVRVILPLIALALGLASSGTAFAQPIGDIANGKVLSGQLCGDCHAIEAGAERSPIAKAPTFDKIASTPGMTLMALSAWLYSSHRTMPLVRLDAGTREDISAYIQSLKVRPRSLQ